MTIDLDALGVAVDAQLALLNVSGDEVGRGWVPIEDVAWNTYGAVTGIDSDRREVTETGYIVHTHTMRSGFGCTGRDQIAVYLADRPGTGLDDTDVLYVELGEVVTVLDPPPGAPPGEAEPWRRMPVEDQILAAAIALDLDVQVLDGEPNPTWQVGDDPPTAMSRVADLLLDGGYARSVGRARPIPHPNRITREPS